MTDMIRTTDSLWLYRTFATETTSAHSEIRIRHAQFKEQTSI